MIIRKNHLDILAIGLLLTCCLLWAFQQVLVKVTLETVPPIMQASLRFGLATGLLMMWCQWRGIRLWQWDDSVIPGLCAALLFSIEFVCLYFGLHYTSPTRLTLFLYTSPFWVALLLPWWRPSERLQWMQWIGLFCAFVAVFLALFDTKMVSLGLQLGDGFGLLAGLFWGLTTVVIRTTTLSSITAERLLFYQIGGCTLIMPLVSWWMGEPWQATWLQMGTFAWFSIAIQSVLGAFLSYLAWMWMLKHYPATQLSSFVFLTPVLTLWISHGWLGETVRWNLVLALFLVTVGIVLVNIKGFRF